jgi:hydrogenase expression/formation protein HypD
MKKEKNEKRKNQKKKGTKEERKGDPMTEMQDFTLTDRPMANRILNALKAMDLKIRVMHVCGGHQDTLVRHGLDRLLMDIGVEIRPGPGCPVCVTTQREIEEAILLAEKRKTITVFGDMMRVPGMKDDLFALKSKGADVRMVYSIDDAAKIAGDHPDLEVVFMAVGFETTAPSTAAAIVKGVPANLSILNTHKLTPPAVGALIAMGEVQLDGFIQPGHVTAITGLNVWEFISTEYKMAQVVAGFEPLDLLMATFMLARQVREGRTELENEYPRVVRAEGNPAGQRVMKEAFDICDAEWRGFGPIPESGLALSSQFLEFDARKRFEDELGELNDLVIKEPPGCRCGEILRGIMYPDECPLFGKTCTPRSPVGPCMVTSEGSCNITLKYGKGYFGK